jgi:hypothetical protein
MCIFSQAVEHVAGTKIFARVLGDEQLLAYEMSFGAVGDLAMVLPLPVQREGAGAEVRFIDLSRYPELFGELSRLFAAPLAFGGPIGRVAHDAPQTLVVHQVGAFEASYVPTRSDFGRLDPRFQLDPAVWDALPVRSITSSTASSTGSRGGVGFGSALPSRFVTIRWSGAPGCSTRRCLVFGSGCWASCPMKTSGPALAARALDRGD